MSLSEVRPWPEEQRKQFEQLRRELRRAFAPFVAEYRALLRSLRQEGFRVRWTCLVYPVQLEGRLPSGERFYFRCRGEQCSLSVAGAKGDPVRAPSWEKDVTRWDWPDAGSLPAAEAERVLRELVALHSSTRASVSPPDPQKRHSRALDQVELILGRREPPVRSQTGSGDEPTSK